MCLLRTTQMILVAGLVGLLSGSLSASIQFQFNYSITPHASDPGLVVNVEKVAAEPESFDLAGVGDSVTFDLFDIWTEEAYVNDDDVVAYPIGVDFQYISPLPQFGGTQTGQTSGMTGQFYWFPIQYGALVWNAPLVLSFGPNDDGELRIDLSDEVFNLGLLGLHGKKGKGARVQATVTMLKEPSGPTGLIPEPNAILTWSGLLGMAIALASWRRIRA